MTESSQRATPTPMMAQYARIKSETPPGSILMFRLGDFYEMFGRDAVEAAPILGVTLTQRAGMPMCGVPWMAVDTYLAKLIRAGKTAALVEASTVCGGVIAGHGPETVAALAQLGRDVGFGFQMIDDLLDFGIGAGNLGKAKHTDLANGVMTLSRLGNSKDEGLRRRAAEALEEMRSGKAGRFPYYDNPVAGEGRTDGESAR